MMRDRPVNLKMGSHHECAFCENWMHHLCAGVAAEQHWCGKCGKREDHRRSFEQARKSRDVNEEPVVESVPPLFRESSDPLARELALEANRFSQVEVDQGINFIFNNCRCT